MIVKKKVSLASLASLLLVSLILAACSGPGSATQPAAELSAPTSVQNNQAATQAEPSPTATQPATLAAAETVPEPNGSSLGQNASAFPDPAGFAWNEVASGLRSPTDLSSAPDDSGRLFFLEQPGVIRIYKAGALLPTPFLDISDKVKSSGNEQGLLGIAFHPDFAQNGFFYVHYTGLQGIGDSVISRFQVTADNPDQADPQSEKVLLTVGQPYENHNGGQLAFGPDGYLYIGLGDGGSANDPRGNGSSLETLLGKILRIDVNSGDPYAIPADNPFANGGGRPEIWAYGLRNPWRFSFDSATGDLWIADVGQNQWEEINFLASGSPGGAHFGWNFFEGTHPFKGNPPPDVQLLSPIYEYQHSEGCSVTGGYAYRGKDLPEFFGIYLFGDFCSGRIWGSLRDGSGNFQTQELFSSGFSITSFGEDRNGEIYLMDRPSGTVYRLARK